MRKLVSRITNYIVHLRAALSVLLGTLVSLDQDKLLHIDTGWGSWWEGMIAGRYGFVGTSLYHDVTMMSTWSHKAAQGII